MEEGQAQSLFTPKESAVHNRAAPHPPTAPPNNQILRQARRRGCWWRVVVLASARCAGAELGHDEVDVGVRHLQARILHRLRMVHRYRDASG